MSDILRKKKILAVASSGGHWVQLQRLRPAFEPHEVRFISTGRDLEAQVKPCPFYYVPDASMWDKLGLLRMALQVFWVVLKFRPDVVISTGAAAGFFALVSGKILGSNTIWIDSIANAEELSLAGRKVRRWADHWCTQWPDLARPEGPKYIGAVL